MFTSALACTLAVVQCSGVFVLITVSLIILWYQITCIYGNIRLCTTWDFYDGFIALWLGVIIWLICVAINGCCAPHISDICSTEIDRENYSGQKNLIDLILKTYFSLVVISIVMSTSSWIHGMYLIWGIPWMIGGIQLMTFDLGLP